MGAVTVLHFYLSWTEDRAWGCQMPWGISPSSIFHPDGARWYERGQQWRAVWKCRKNIYTWVSEKRGRMSEERKGSGSYENVEGQERRQAVVSIVESHHAFTHFPFSCAISHVKTLRRYLKCPCTSLIVCSQGINRTFPLHKTATTLFACFRFSPKHPNNGRHVLHQVEPDCPSMQTDL